MSDTATPPGGTQTESGDLHIKIPPRFKVAPVALAMLLVTLAGSVAKAAYHAASVSTRLSAVEAQLEELSKDSARLRRMELVLCRICAQDPNCRGACGDQ